jgi:hypothetical protein
MEVDIMTKEEEKLVREGSVLVKWLVFARALRIVTY